MRIASELGAGRLVEGEVVGDGRRLTISARIIEVPSGTTGSRATVEGAADSLAQLVDRLAGTLLVLGAGEEEQRLAALTSTSLPALRAYLDGEALLRRGAFVAAERKFLDALAVDSTFALAGLGAAAQASQQAAANDLLHELDSALADPVNVEWASYGNLIAARLHEQRGEIPAALVALRRRFTGNAYFPHYVTYLRDEGRLAALTGDRAGAIRAYSHYLALRSEAEPILQPEVRAVRAELEVVERESTDR